MWLTSWIQRKAYFDKSAEMSANRSLGSSLWEQEKYNHYRRKILKSNPIIPKKGAISG
ncbi:hypothetical protein [Prevotella sp. MGM1]|uniref:hypothetical protein n=1 Tax=Prevotella sp. MGM1 TaxID=2033405 RepID=UPI00130484AE|nr:hypothetical protein [Prevotella sp. MGM1]